MGVDCGSCNFVAACPEHPTGAHYGRRRDLLPGILTVTPTGLDTWRRCPREWRNALPLGIPSSDTDAGGVHGQQMHDVLRIDPRTRVVPRRRPRRRRARRERVRHRPTGCAARSTRHAHALPRSRGVARARDHRGAVLPPPDHAVHGHRALRRALGARRCARRARLQDRSGVVRPRGRRQAGAPPGVGARTARRARVASRSASRSSTWRRRCSTTPSRSSPMPTISVAIEEELRLEVAAIRQTTEFAGVADTEVCRRCRYRSICPDSTAPGVPVWPTVESEDARWSTA